MYQLKEIEYAGIRVRHDAFDVSVFAGRVTITTHFFAAIKRCAEGFVVDEVGASTLSGFQRSMSMNTPVTNTTDLEEEDGDKSSYLPFPKTPGNPRC